MNVKWVDFADISKTKGLKLKTKITKVNTKAIVKKVLGKKKWKR